MTRDPAARPVVDEAARERVVAQLDRSFCVEAAAGTGKTTLLVNRILRLLEEGHIRAAQLAAITFTELAAAELKSRIRARLAESDNPAHKTALEELEAAQISTIHALALAILKERPVEAGLDPGFETVDASRAAELFDELWRTWLGEQAGGESEDGPGTPVLRLAFSVGLNVDHLSEAARALYEHRDVALSDTGAAERAEAAARRVPACLEEAAAAVREHLPELERLLDASCLDHEDKLALAIRALQRALEAYPPPGGEFGGLVEALSWAVRVFELAPVLKRGSFTNVGALKRWQGRAVLEEARSRLAAVAEAIRGVDQAAREAVAERLAAWLRGFVAWAQEEKKRRGLADFLDQLLWCRDLLRDDLSARHHFQRRFRAVLVDEFQDTDPLQAEIVFYLAEQEPRAFDWKDVKLGPGRLFIVGDPKQSIYRFRRADVEMYREAAAILEAQGQRETIRQNFRTLRSITDAVNAFFERWMTPPYQPDYVPLDAYRPDPPDGLAALAPGAYRLELPQLAERAEAGAGGKVSTEDLRRMEARATASALARLVGEGRLQVADGGTWRPATWQDAVVLLPTFTDVEIFEEALQEAGVPFRVVGGRLFYYRPEIRELSLVLSAVYNPCDELAVLGALRSGFFGVSDAELWRFHRHGGRLDASVPPPGEARTAAPRVAEALEQIRVWHRRCTPMRPVQALRQILDESGYRAYLHLEPDGARAAGNVDKLLAQAAALEMAGPISFGAFVEWLVRRGPGGPAPADEEDSPLADDDNVVRIMTVHKAKGLEFPIVFAANLSQSRNEPGSAVVDRQGGRVELRIGGGDFKFETCGFSQAYEQEKLRLAAERVRLYYVALTRARDYLFISGAPYEDGFWAELEKTAGPQARESIPPLRLDELLAPAQAAAAASDLGANGDAGGIDVNPGAVSDASTEAGGPDGTAGPGDGPSLEREAREWQQRRRMLLESAGQGLRVVPARLAVAAGTGEAATAPPHAVSPPPAVSGPEYDGTRVGQAFHLVMEQVARGGFAVDEEWLGRWVGAVAERSKLTPDERSAVESWTRRACRGALAEMARRSSRCMAEVPFIYTRDDGALVEGRMDLLLVGPDGQIVVVDYKTDPKSPEQLLETYAGQVRVYAEAASRAVPAAEVRVVLYAARSGQLVEASEGDPEAGAGGAGGGRPAAE